MVLSSSELQASPELQEQYRKALQFSPHLSFVTFAGDREALHELPWVEVQPFLLRRGYRLRPRYHPDWTPPWLDGRDVTPDVLLSTEEYLSLMNGNNLLDAVRTSDGARVVLRRVETSTNEIPVLQYLSSSALRADPCNRTVPILDIIPSPNDDTHAFVVMPQLVLFSLLPFRRLGEVVAAFRQLIKGLDFMHSHNITHSDACYFNLMMDSAELIPRGVHFMQPYSHGGTLDRNLEWHDRGKRQCNYYFIDFQLSERYPMDQSVIECVGLYGQDRTVPEFHENKPFDPFKVDIYQLGNVITKLIQDEYEGLEPLLELATAMTRINPLDRISLQDALKELDRVPQRILKRRIWRQTCPWTTRVGIQYCGVKSTNVYW